MLRNKSFRANFLLLKYIYKFIHIFKDKEAMSENIQKITTGNCHIYKNKQCKNSNRFVLHICAVIMP